MKTCQVSVQLETLKKVFGENVALDIDTFTVHSGDVLGLVGNNGAGKTTLFRLILDLLKPNTGMVTIKTEDAEYITSKTEDWKAFTGAYIDSGFLIDYLTPREFFDLSRNLSAMPDAVFEESLQLCAPLLEGVPDALIRTLSAGNRQKVGLASAFLRRPQLVVLDEPFTFLDPSSQHTFKAFLSSYVQQHPSSIVLISSHDLHHVTDVSTRIALMEGGKIIRTFSSSAEALSQLKDYFSSRA